MKFIFLWLSFFVGQKTPAVLGNPLEDDLDRIPRKGIVKLGDFGIARVLDSSTAGAQTTIGPGVQGSAPEGGGPDVRLDRGMSIRIVGLAVLKGNQKENLPIVGIPKNKQNLVRVDAK